MSKLGLKIFLMILLVSIGGLLFTSIFINYSIERHFNDYLYLEKKEKIENLVEIIETSVNETGNWINTKMIVHDFIKVNAVLIRIEDFEGRTVFNWQQGLMNRMMQMRGFSRKNLNNYLQLDHEKFPIKYKDNVIAQLYWYYSPALNLTARASFFSSRVSRIIILAGVLVALATIIISLFFSRYLTRPLLRMNSMAHKVANGDFDQQVEMSGNDELAQLGRSFNEMVNKLRYLEKIRKESTSDLAHELRTPLTIINSYIEGIEEGIISLNENTVSEIKEELERLIKLVNRLGELAKAEKKVIKAEMKEVNLNNILNKLIKRYKPLANDKQIEFRTKLLEDIKISADPESLEIIFSNLITNAIKYTTVQGIVSIVMNRNNQEIIIQIKDNGIGISKEDQKLIFERFYRTDKSRSTQTGGAGIGLTITRELVEAMGGRIKVNSPGPGKGTTFTIYLPEQ